MLTGVNFKIYLNKLEVGQIYNGGRLEYRYYKQGRVSIMCGVFTEYGGSDKYDDNISLDLEKGKSYYLKGEGKKLVLVSTEIGKKEFENNTDFKGSINFIDDKPLDFSYTGKEVNASSINTEITNVQDVQPEIFLSSPKVSGSDLKTTAEKIKVSGYVISKSGVKNVQINGETFPSDDVGNFSTQLTLKEGLNKVTISIQNEKNQKAEKTFNIIKEVAEEPVANSTESAQEEVTYRGSDPFKGTNVANAAKEIKAGKYYALFIGIDAYSGTWKPLKNAVNDAKALENLLKTQYKFDVVKTLYNAAATRTSIIDEMEWLVNTVKENDNVLIYYSGHGELKKELNKGFWVPADAKTTSVANYISNSDIQTFLASIPSKHTLMVSDA